MANANTRARYHFVPLKPSSSKRSGKSPVVSTSSAGKSAAPIRSRSEKSGVHKSVAQKPSTNKSAANKPGLGALRIIGGSLRGSKLAVPDVAGLRPTPDRVRETLFNWLAPTISGARCLDLFAGTGALGIEALSRGAAHVDFVERDAHLAQLLRDNLARLKQSQARIIHGDALGLLAGSPLAPFNLVFIDPPFDADLWQSAAQRLEDAGWLSGNALIYIESPAARAIVVPSAWQLHRDNQAGAVRYALYRRSVKLAL